MLPRSLSTSDESRATLYGSFAYRLAAGVFRTPIGIRAGRESACSPSGSLSLSGGPGNDRRPSLIRRNQTKRNDGMIGLEFIA